MESKREREGKPWKICRVISESSQFIVREWSSSFSFEQTNIKICFCILLSWKWFWISEKVRESSGNFPVSPLPAWNERFHCCPFSGWESSFSGQRSPFVSFSLSLSLFRCAIFMSLTSCDVNANMKSKHYDTENYSSIFIMSVKDANANLKRWKKRKHHAFNESYL